MHDYDESQDSTKPLKRKHVETAATDETTQQEETPPEQRDQKKKKKKQKSKGTEVNGEQEDE